MKQPALLFCLVPVSLVACFTPDVDAVREKWQECAVVPEEGVDVCAEDQGSEACSAAYESAILKSVDSAEEEACILAVDCEGQTQEATDALTECLE
jgi:hypothetical protein